MTKKSVVLLPPEVGFSKYNPSISKVSLSNHRYKAVLHAFCCYCCCCVAKRRMMKNVFVFVSFMLQLLLLCMYVCTIMIIHYYYYYIIVRSSIITQRRPNHGTGSSHCTGAQTTPNAGKQGPQWRPVQHSTTLTKIYLSLKGIPQYRSTQRQVPSCSKLMLQP